jgi:type II secretory pathway predicted ATPase ExeA
MNYFAPLGLAREPFSNSPDPNFLYDSRQHAHCLQQLEISVRLRRGLCVVTGEIGTGKTTLCRRFVRLLGQDQEIRVHLLLDPYFATGEAFLRVLFGFFTGREPAPGLSAWQLKEGIKKSLFLQGVKAGRLSVLIVDEGQKLTPECLELMRELLNYETNAQKLLQIVVFAQREIEPVLEEMENLLDRVNCYHRLTPLDFAETRAMIRYRLQEAAADKSAPPDLFSNLGYWAVYRASRGYPRRIVRLCHKVVLELLIRRSARAGWRLVRSCVGQERRQVRRAFGTAATALAVFVLACASVWGLYRFDLGGIRQSRALTGLSQAAARILPAEPAPELRQTLDLPAAPARIAPEPPVPAPAAAPEPPAPEALKKAAVQEPERLGVLHLAQGENLVSVLRQVYGAADPETLARVRAANPGLEAEPGPGAALVLPLVSGRQDAAFKQFIWVQLARADSLEAAFDALRALDHLPMPLRLLVWQERPGRTQFAVTAATPFAGEPRALALIGSLPGKLRDDARMLQFSRKDVRFLSRLDEPASRLATAQDKDR